MYQIFLYFISLLLASFFLLNFTILILRNCNFYSKPTDRGLHKDPVITSGGSYFIFYIVFIYLTFDGTIIGYSFLEISLILIFAIIFGIYDDKNNLTRRFKLLTQIILSLILIIFFNFQLLQNFFPSLNYTYIYLFLNIFFIIAFINFVNFIDGSDGNLILFVFFIFIFLLIKLNFIKEVNEYIYLLYFIPFLVSFYLLNIRKKIFLGESGSLYLGIFLVLNLEHFAIKEIMKISDLLIISSYFLVDMIITFVLRIYIYGFNSFKAHRDHSYQFFCHLMNDHKKFNLFMGIYNFGYILPIYLLNLLGYIPEFISVLLCIVPPVFFVLKYSPLIKILNEKK